MDKTLLNTPENFINISVIGAGYVGLVTGTCLATLGFKVCCFDIDTNKIHNLQLGKISIYEPQLPELISEQTKLKNLTFTNDLETAVNHAQAIFIAVGTPQDVSGKANLTFVDTAIAQIATFLTPEHYKLIIIKSTVPVGTCRNIQDAILKINPQANFDIASNPEFLREGSAVFDFMDPDRIIIGTNQNINNTVNQTIAKSHMILKKIYKKFIEKNIPILFNDLESSELIKYASNCFLATKITFVNELADLCESLNTTLDVHTDILKITHGMGLDKRIGSKFLQPGPGFGGSCFPKDNLALNYCATQHDINLSILSTTIESNNNRINSLSTKIISICGGTVKNKIIAILGIAFKANTDDIRDSVAIPVINDLSNNGATLQIYDPQAMEQGKIFFQDKNNIHWLNNSYAAITNANAIVILTEWLEFTNLNLAKIKNLTNNQYPIVIDFRNLFSIEIMQNAEFNYYSIGRKYLNP